MKALIVCFLLVWLVAGLWFERKPGWTEEQSVQQQITKVREDLRYETQRATNAEWCLQTVITLTEQAYEGEALSGDQEYAKEYCTRNHLWPSRR